MREPYGYKEFKVNEILERVSAGYKGEGRYQDNSQVERTKEFSLPLLSAKYDNNGILYYGRPKEWETHKNVVGVVSSGAVAAGLVYAYKDLVSVRSTAYLLKLRDEENKDKFGVMQYIATAMEKTLFERYSREYAPTWRRINDNKEKVVLPKTPEGEPDYEYMEEYIDHIKGKYMGKIEETYLEDYQELEGVEIREPYGYKEFKVEELFKVTPTSHYGELKDYEVEDDTGEGNVPFITTTVSNNGIRAYSKLEPNNEGNTITYSDTTTEDAIFYQPIPYIGRSHVQRMDPRFELSEGVALYIISCIRRSSKGLYDYSHKFNRTRMNATDITLPITSEGTPDYDYMEEYIDRIKSKKMRVIKEYVEGWQDERALRI